MLANCTPLVDAASKELIDPLVQGRLRLPEIITERDPGFEPIKQEFDRIRRAFQETAKIHEDQRFVITPASQLRIKAALMNILASLYEAGQLPYEDSLPDPRIEARIEDLHSGIGGNYEHERTVFLPVF